MKGFSDVFLGCIMTMR